METRELGRTGHKSSILIFGGFAVGWSTQKEADAALEMARDAGINHIDVAPAYGESEARIGDWLKRHGKQFFIGCKTAERTKEGAEESLKRSLERLNVDAFDLFQFHGVDSLKVVKTILGPGGALEAVLEAKEQGLVKNIGITGHTPPVYNEALDLYDFATVMFPLNRVHGAHPNATNDFKPILKTAREKNVGVMAIKSVAKRTWQAERGGPNGYHTWYEPFDDVENIEKSLRYTLSQDITAAVLPGELKLWEMIIDAAKRFSPLDAAGQKEVMAEVDQYEPLVGPMMD